LGAKFVPHSKLNGSITPIEKKLQATLKTSKTSKDVVPHKADRGIEKDGKARIEYNGSDDDEEESKSSHFSRKASSNSSKAWLIQNFQKGKKKRKIG
jgi:hypothetical protein